MNRTGRTGALLAASLAALAGVGAASSGASAMVVPVVHSGNSASNGHVQKSTPSRTAGTFASAAKAILSGYRGHTSRRSFPNGPGWTQAQVQRMAKKRRNRAKNRAAHR